MKNIFKSNKETHGKDEALAAKKNSPSTLDQIWGEDGTSKFGTLDLNKYEGRLDGMTKSEVQAEAQKHGLVPIEDTQRLRKSLIQQFKQHSATYTAKPQQKTFQRKRDPKKEAVYSEDVLRILREGA